MENTEKNNLKLNLSEKEKEIFEHQITLISTEILSKREPKICEIFKKFKKKMTESKSNLFLHHEIYNFQSDEYKDLFRYEKEFPLKDKNEFTFIYDCLNFIVLDYKKAPKELNNKYYIDIINSIFSILKEKGTVIFLIDHFYLENFFPNLILALGENYRTKIFINFYYIDIHNFIFVVTIQKMSKSDKPIDLKEQKVLITDYFSHISSKMIGSVKLGEINPYLTNQMSIIKSYHLQCKLNYSRLSSLCPGEFFQMRLKSSPLNPYLSFLINIHDSSTNTDKKNKRTVAVAVSYEISQELLFAKYFTYDVMSEQLNAGRLIILESAILNPTDIKELALELTEEIQMMRPEGYNDEVIIKVWSDQNKKTLVFKDDNYLIRDNEDNQLNLRQLLCINDKKLENMILSKIKIKFASKSKVNNPKSGTIYYPIETPDKFKNKGVIECIDENNIHGFYEKCIICMVFYMNLDMLPKNTIKIMDIGAGIGIISFYFYRLFKGCCEIDNIEKNKSIYDLGIKYFGLKNYDIHKNRVHWFFEDAKLTLDKMVKFSENEGEKIENKYEHKKGFYDLIINEINNIEPKEETIPPKEQFTDEFLNNIKKLLSSSGIYIINIMSKNYKGIFDNYQQLERHFPSIFCIPSENWLCSIFICFKNNINIDISNEIYKKNNKLIENNSVVQFSMIEPIKNEVITRIKETDEVKNKLEENAKFF